MNAMHIRVCDIFKIGIGPSSSHTLGPMLAAYEFIQQLKATNMNDIQRIEARLYGSLAHTGKGHASDDAIILGFSGYLPEKLINVDKQKIIQSIYQSLTIVIDEQIIQFDPRKDLIFDLGAPLPFHPNGMEFSAYNVHDERVHQAIWYSIGGGFIVNGDSADEQILQLEPKASLPFEFTSAKELLKLGEQHQLRIDQMVRANECQELSNDQLNQQLDTIWDSMNRCIDRGLTASGELPGGLHVKRRAKALYEPIQQKKSQNAFEMNELLLAYAMAVNEENAAGNQVVTAPTNGAAGIIPAVLRYAIDCLEVNKESVHTFLLVATAIGSLLKRNASISGAEVGCQGEVGSAAAMAAAGLCAILGGSNSQVENAAEIALEHHLGLTCDPINGLVQIPCIERNGIGAVKAVTAAQLALRGNGEHMMPLDNCIKTMLETGKDMSDRYKETSQAGLAVNLPEC